MFTNLAFFIKTGSDEKYPFRLDCSIRFLVLCCC